MYEPAVPADVLQPLLIRTESWRGNKNEGSKESYPNHRQH